MLSLVCLCVRQYKWFLFFCQIIFCTSQSTFLGYIFVTLIKTLVYRIVTTREKTGAATMPRKILVNDQLDAQFFFLYVYFNSLHVSSSLVLIIRRINCINTTSGMCHSDRLLCRSGSSFPTCILDCHLHRVTHTRCCIDTIDSPDDEHEVARNM
jgi:hypothetical protein